jgi:hypothetical protein
MALPLIAAGLGAAGSLYQIGSGISQGIKAKELAKDYNRQALENVYSKVGISTAAEKSLKEK